MEQYKEHSKIPTENLLTRCWTGTQRQFSEARGGVQRGNVMEKTNLNLNFIPFTKMN